MAENPSISLLLVNPNKAGFFEGCSYFKKNLFNINITLRNCQTIYLKYIESDKMPTSSVIS